MHNPIIVALDAMTEADALSTAKHLSGYVWGFKVNDLLIDCGLSIVSKLKAYGNVFADPKLHDIPNTVVNGVRKLDDAGADLITLHASGGLKMIQAGVAAAKNAKVIAVTLLTSMSEADSMHVYQRNPAAAVLHFAKLTADAGAAGIVCSPKELALLLEQPEFSKLEKVVPGVRPEWYGKADDQTRTDTPKAALTAGATYLVIGRPIIQHRDPVEAAELILKELR